MFRSLLLREIYSFLGFKPIVLFCQSHWEAGRSTGMLANVCSSAKRFTPQKHAVDNAFNISRRQERFCKTKQIVHIKLCKAAFLYSAYNIEFC